MKEEQLSKLESKIYIFSVDVFSFVKTLLDMNITNSDTTGLLKSSNLLYTKFLDVFENQPSNFDTSISACLELSAKCSGFLEKIEVEKKLLNEKIDLIIESKEIVTALEKISR